MPITRRGLVATTLPLLMLSGTARVTFAKTGAPLQADACRPQDGPKACATGKGAAGGCPHCAALAKQR